MAKEYIEQRSGGLYVAGTRVSLASVVLRFKHGATPEEIIEDFPSLATLENVKGAIGYYLENQSKVEEYLEAQEKKWEEFRKTADPLPPGLRARPEGLRR